MNAPVKTECWSGKIFTGSWVAAQGGVAPVLEAATGAALGEIGVASPEDRGSALRPGSPKGVGRHTV